MPAPVAEMACPRPGGRGEVGAPNRSCRMAAVLIPLVSRGNPAGIRSRACRAPAPRSCRCRLREDAESQASRTSICTQRPGHALGSCFRVPHPARPARDGEREAADVSFAGALPPPGGARISVVGITYTLARQTSRNGSGSRPLALITFTIVWRGSIVALPRRSLRVGGV
jgi:hypothetical protein